MKIEIDIPDPFISDEDSYISISGDSFEYCRFDKFYRGLQCNHKKKILRNTMSFNQN